MRLVSLLLENYRQFKDVYLEFPDGVTGIIGLNGVGKSSLVEAIAWALYGHVAARTTKEGIKRDFAGLLEESGVNLQLEINGDYYQVIRRMSGLSQTTQARLMVNGKQLATSTRSVEEEIVKLLALDWQSFYTSFFAKQKELNSLSDLTPSVRKEQIIRMLRINSIDEALNLVKTDGREVKMRIEVLTHQLPNQIVLKEEMGRKKQSLSEIEELISTKKQLIEELTKNQNEFQIILEEQKNKSKQFNELMKEKATLTATLTVVKTRQQEIIIQLNELGEIENELKQLEPKVSQWETLNQRNQELEDLKYKAQTQRELQVRKQEIIQEFQQAEEEISKEKKLVDELTQGEKASKENETNLDTINQEIKDLSGLIGTKQAEINHHRQEYERIGQSRRTIVQLGPEAKCPTCQRPLGDDYLRIRQHLDKEGEKIKAGGLKLKKELEELRKKEDQRKEEQKLFKEVIWRKREQISQLKSEMGKIEELKKRRDYWQKQLKQIEERLIIIGEVQYDSATHQKLKKEIDVISKMKEEVMVLRTKISQKEHIMANLKQEEEKIAKFELQLNDVAQKISQLNFEVTNYEKIEENYKHQQKELLRSKDDEKKLELTKLDCQKDIERIEMRLRDFQLFKEEITQLGQKLEMLSKLANLMTNFRLDLISRIRPQLAELTSHLYTQVTEGKYQKIEIDEDYEMYIYEAGKKYALNRFSGGEIDLANLCLRIAISQLIVQSSRTNQSFIVLDEIFGSQDNFRRTAIMNTLSHLSRIFRQILVVTHVEEIKDSLEHIIEVFEDESGISYVKQY